ncbi:MAG: tape measure protein [Spirochaetaceae bacterium]|nr:tape measure protein [Spirochaetaceae bacterium]
MELTDELKVLVEAEVGKALQEFERLNKKVDEGKKKTASLGDALDKLSGPSTVLAGALAGAGVTAIKFAGNLEQTQLALEVLLGDAAKATQIKDEWTQLAAATPFDSADIDEAGKKLLAFDIEANKVTETLRRIGDISAATGSSISDIADIYGKAKVQGRLFAEDINQFQGRGIPVLQSLAKVLGVAESEVRDLVSEGKVGFPELEQAFNLMTDEGGRFNGMMEKLSTSTLGKFNSMVDNAQLTLASFGDILLPIANDAMDAISGILEELQGLDDGSKRFIVTTGGVAAAIAAAIPIVKGLSAAMAVMAANPVILGITAAGAAVALIAGAASKAAHAYEDYNSELAKTKSASDSLLSSYANGNTAKQLDETTTRDLIALYPELRGEVSAYSTTVEEAAKAVEELNKQKVLDSATAQIAKLQKLEDKLEDAAETYDKVKKKRDEYYSDPARMMNWNEGSVIDTQFQGAEDAVKNLTKKLEAGRTQVEAALSSINHGLEEWNIVELPAPEIPVEEVAAELDKVVVELDKAGGDALKTWQQWWTEITKVGDGSFETGVQAGQLYVEGMERELANSTAIAEALGKSLDMEAILDSQMSQIEGDLEKLLAITADKIAGGDIFEIDDKSVNELIEKYRELAEAKNKALVTEELDQMREAVDRLGMSEAELLEVEKQLAVARLEGLGATEAQIEEYKKLFDQLNSKGEDDPFSSWEEKLAGLVENALMQLEGMSQQMAEMVGGFVVQFANIGLDGLMGGLDAVGQALGEGKDAAEAWNNAMTQMAMQLLENLPTMFLQAGLQLIAQGQWALGLGFVAAAGSTALISGFTKGKVAQAEENAEANATGGVYGGGESYRAFARGGAFTNSIVTEPTNFRFAKGGGFGLGLMGEAGPEAIMPLKRTADGSLGVSAEGFGGGDVAMMMKVIVNNYSSEKVEANESQGEGGERQLEITIGSMINKHITSGKADKSLGSRYGLKAKGV